MKFEGLLRRNKNILPIFIGWSFHFNVCSVSIIRVQYDFNFHDLVRKDDNYFIIWLVRVNSFFDWICIYLSIFHLLHKSKFKKFLKHHLSVVQKSVVSIVMFVQYLYNWIKLMNLIEFIWISRWLDSIQNGRFCSYSL